MCSGSFRFLDTIVDAAEEHGLGRTEFQQSRVELRGLELEGQLIDPGAFEFGKDDGGNWA